MEVEETKYNRKQQDRKDNEIRPFCTQNKIKL